MKILILILMCLFILPVCLMGESPPTVAPALQFDGLALDTIAVSVNQDAAFVLYDRNAVVCSYDSLAIADKYKMISSSVNAKPYSYTAFGEPDIVLRL